MKVKDLVKKLLELDQDATVVKNSDNFELKGAIIEVYYIPQYDTGKRKIGTFIDAFDNESYDKEVFELFGGSEKIVKI